MAREIFSKLSRKTWWIQTINSKTWVSSLRRNRKKNFMRKTNISPIHFSGMQTKKRNGRRPNGRSTCFRYSMTKSRRLSIFTLVVTVSMIFLKTYRRLIKKTIWIKTLYQSENRSSQNTITFPMQHCTFLKKTKRTKIMENALRLNLKCFLLLELMAEFYYNQVYLRPNKRINSQNSKRN